MDLQEHRVSVGYINMCFLPFIFFPPPPCFEKLFFLSAMCRHSGSEEEHGEGPLCCFVLLLAGSKAQIIHYQHAFSECEINVDYIQSFFLFYFFEGGRSC